MAVLGIRKKSGPLSRWSEMPVKAMIELTNACNFSCTMCANGKMKRKKSFMSMELFDLALDRCEEAGIPLLKLYTVGESFLHPQFTEMFKRAALRNFKSIAVATNGALLSERIVRELLKSDKCVILYSFAGWDKKSYEERYRGGVFEEAVEKIRSVIGIVRDKGLPDRTFQVRGVVSNERERKKCVDFFERVLELKSSQITCVISHNWADEVFARGGFSRFVNTILSGIVPRETYCGIADERVGILSDGRVTACACLDVNADLIIGDIREQGIKEIRNSPRFRELIGRFKHGNLKGLMCHNCSVRF